jgi:hypothetical protein
LFGHLLWTGPVSSENLPAIFMTYDAPSLETRIVDCLKEQGHTIEELQHRLKEPVWMILVVLTMLKNDNYVTISDTGAWTILREESQ